MQRIWHIWHVVETWYFDIRLIYLTHLGESSSESVERTWVLGGSILTYVRCIWLTWVSPQVESDWVSSIIIVAGSSSNGGYPRKIAILEILELSGNSNWHILLIGDRLAVPETGMLERMLRYRAIPNVGDTWLLELAYLLNRCPYL